MKKILVTGGAGFIASSLVDKLLETGKYSVVSVDNFISGKREFLAKNKNYRFFKCDVNNYSQISKIMERELFDYVFHYAALVGVRVTLENPRLVLRDIDGLKNIFDLSIKTKVERIFFSSSSEVYGESLTFPQHEHDTPLNSKLPYAVVKNLGECFCRAYHKEDNLNYTIFRFFNTYGLRQSNNFVISKFLEAAFNKDYITVYGDGSQKRTFCYIEDNTDFTIKILENNLFINETVNVGSDTMISISDLAQIIVKLTGSKAKVIQLPALEEGDMKQRQPDITKMMSVLRRPLVSLENGLYKMIRLKYGNELPKTL